MSILSNSYKINIFVQFHILCVDSQDLESTDLIRHSNIDLPIESSKPSQSRVERVRPVCGSNNNDMSSSLETVHQCQELRNNSSFHLTMNLLSVWSN